MTKVDVKQEVLQWAVGRAGGIERIQEKVPKVVQWIKSESKPTIKQLEKLAKTTSTPLGYFFLQEPPKEEFTVPHYRTVDTPFDKPSIDLIDTIRTMERRQAWMREYLIDNGHDPLEFVGSANLTDNPKDIAKRIRSTINLEEGWASKCRNWEDALRLLILQIEDAGILVMANGVVGNNTRRKLDVQEFRGFVLIDKYAPLVFLNSSDGKAAQMFTLAHEIAHIWFGASGIFDLKALQPSDERVEQICNQVAAEFLIPTDEMYLTWKKISRLPDRYQYIARTFKVSELVAVRRALDLELITRKEYFEFYEEREELLRQKPPGKGGDFYKTQNSRIGRRFGDAVVNCALQGRTLFREAYMLTDLNSKTFTEFAKQRNGGR